MNEKKFDELMDGWAAQEMKAAPDISPAPEVYRKLEEKAKKRARRVLSWTLPWAAVGLAGTAVVLLIVLQPSPETAFPVGLRKEFVGEREAGALALKEEKQAAGEAAKPTAPAVSARSRMDKDETGGKEKSALPKKEAAPERIVFEYQLDGAPDVKAWDIAAPRDGTLFLSTDDNYRVAVDLARECYLHVFQVGPGDSLARLFPGSGDSSAENPLQPGRFLIPVSPDWFFPMRAGGDATIYVVRSSGPNVEWNDLVERYTGPAKAREREKIRSALIGDLDRLRETPEEGVSVRIFRFKVRE